MKYFTVTELTRSATATKLGILNTPSESVINNLELLVYHILDPLRELYGKPITVTSGYRSQALNKSVGGAVNSQHIKGEAADITTGSISGNKYIYSLLRQLPVDQAINEHNFSWIHVSFSSSHCRHQFFACH